MKFTIKKIEQRNLIVNSQPFLKKKRIVRVLLCLALVRDNVIHMIKNRSNTTSIKTVKRVDSTYK